MDMVNASIVILLIAVGAIAVKSALKHFKGQGGCCGGGDYQAKRRKLKTVVWEKTFLVSGMHCRNCVNRVMEKVQDMNGTSCRVDLKKGRVIVTADHEMVMDVLRDVIVNAGYEVTGTL